MDVGDWEGKAKLVGVDGGTGEARGDVIYKRQYRTEKLVQISTMSVYI